MAELNVPGASLYYEDSGGDGTPVVFMHPASGSADSWQFQLPAFQARGYRTVTYDLRGWGRSRPDPQATDRGCMSDDLLALVDHLSLQNFVLVAAAYGGFGGVDFALRFPGRLQSLRAQRQPGRHRRSGLHEIRERVVSAPIRGCLSSFASWARPTARATPRASSAGAQSAMPPASRPPQRASACTPQIMLPMLAGSPRPNAVDRRRRRPARPGRADAPHRRAHSQPTSS